jgi:AP endonuclease
MIGKLGSDRLRIIFDPLNMLIRERVDSQEVLWRECIDAFGKETEVIHLKDGVFPDKGRHVPCKLGDGVMRYEIIAKWIKKEKSDITIIREEARYEYAKEDLVFMKRLFI